MTTDWVVCISKYNLDSLHVEMFFESLGTAVVNQQENICSKSVIKIIHQCTEFCAKWLQN